MGMAARGHRWVLRIRDPSKGRPRPTGPSLLVNCYPHKPKWYSHEPKHMRAINYISVN